MYSETRTIPRNSSFMRCTKMLQQSMCTRCPRLAFHVKFCFHVHVKKIHYNIELLKGLKVVGSKMKIHTLQTRRGCPITSFGLISRHLVDHMTRNNRFCIGVFTIPRARMNANIVSSTGCVDDFHAKPCALLCVWIRHQPKSIDLAGAHFDAYRPLSSGCKELCNFHRRRIN